MLCRVARAAILPPAGGLRRQAASKAGPAGGVSIAGRGGRMPWRCDAVAALEMAGGIVYRPLS